MAQTQSKNAKGLNFAKIFNIDYRIYNINKKKHFEILLNELNKRKISLICLAGYMKILSKEFIERFRGKIINIHPSLLPKYKGLNTFTKAIKNKDKQAGCTVHYVNKKLDSGQIILQKKVIINRNDTEKSLKEKIQKKEYKAYSEAVRKIFSNINS
tara:strand:- start:72 stop:539 length:468 start_codon:yes stop_codon:yes gene_type:complete